MKGNRTVRPKKEKSYKELEWIWIILTDMTHISFKAYDTGDRLIVNRLPTICPDSAFDGRSRPT